MITVGASDDKRTVSRDDDTVADFSSRGPTVDGLPKPDVVAPGTQITAANSAKSLDGKISKGVDYVTHSGTSMATPVCSGIAALLLEAHPGLTPDEVKARIVDTQDLGADVNAQGRGLVDAKAAVLGTGAVPPRTRRGSA